MGSSQNFPIRRDGASTTASVAELITALEVPAVDSVDVDIQGMAGLPPLPLPYSPQAKPTGPVAVGTDDPRCQLDVARTLMDQCVSAVEKLTKHQNQCAALAADLIERLHTAVSLEAGILSFDGWQARTALQAMEAELAMVLHIPEGAANKLMEHATTLVRDLPTTMKHLHGGDLGWEHAVVIADETSLLRDAGAVAADIDSFELQLLGKAEDATVPSFREKARRLRERRFPESIVPRTRRAYADRQMTKGRAQDGMSWLGLYAPAPTVEGIWDQCTATAQAAQGPHESRTLSQLRVDIASAMLLNQSLAENQIFAPAARDAEASPVSVPAPATTAPAAADKAQTPRPGWDSPAAASGSAGHEPLDDPVSANDAESELPAPWLIPAFDDPDYKDPGFKEPDVHNDPWWIPTARPPALQQVPETGRCNDASRLPVDVTGHRGSSNTVQWPPMPRVMPIVLIPALSMLGVTDEPAWMEGAGPISMEVAKHLAADATSLYRILVDPLTNEPLDLAPDRYRIGRAMRTSLRVREEYCQFPGCMAKASSSQIDHIESFSSGGSTTVGNLEVLCLHHHLLKHFKDDKTRSGKFRSEQSVERQRVSLRGWVPCMTDTGRVSWTSPMGRFYAAESNDRQLPQYPKWFQALIEKSLEGGTPRCPVEPDENAVSAQANSPSMYPCWDEESAGDVYPNGMSDECDAMPSVFNLDEYEEAQLLQQAIEHAAEWPTSGQADAA